MILAVNAGSSSLKFALHACEPEPDWRSPAALPTADAVLTGHVQGLEPGGTPRLRWQVGAQKGGHALDAHESRTEGAGASPFGLALDAIRGLVDDHFDDLALDAVAHRVVHGGARHTVAVEIDDGVLADLEALTPLAPLHQPHALQAIRSFQSAFPEVPQIGCFDTAFHATLAEIEYSYPLPRDMTARGIRRYGFHGLSYQYVIGRLRSLSPARAGGRVVMAHLGNGASLCATQDGLSRATTMGLTPLDGLMMGTRCGTVDPGILLCMMHAGLSADRLQDLLWKQSGLLGVSGRSADMRMLQKEPDDAARLAVDMFCLRVARETAALAVSVGGLDLLAFTGGIGEHSAAVRADVARRLACLGIEVDEARNRDASGAGAVAIHAADSAVEVWVVPTDEGRVAASEAARLLAANH